MEASSPGLLAGVICSNVDKPVPLIANGGCHGNPMCIHSECPKSGDGCQGHLCNVNTFCHFGVIQYAFLARGFHRNGFFFFF